MSLSLSPYIEAIEHELKDILSTEKGSTSPLYQMMRYHMGWLDQRFQPADAPHGKRLRPVLCLLACEAASGDWRPALPAAAAIELIHNFSLLHDDIEDDSETRRHRPTVWTLWGIPQAINTGDAMWAVSRLALYRLLDLGHSAQTVLRVAQSLDKAGLELCTGQYLDLHFETIDVVSLSQYERMIAGKTAALLSASLATGALLGGADPTTVDAYDAFGHEWGLTFQITDDILGTWGTPSVTGKPTATDILTKKKTLPLLYALRWEQDNGYDDLSKAYAQPTLSEADIPAVLSLLERAGALQYARAQAQEHHQRALSHLQAIQAEGLPAQDMLRELAISILDRSF